jgi:hypothetical protein
MVVKVDMARDYYGDLELQPTADLNEIKKQFRKLGMSSLGLFSLFTWFS